MNSRLVLADHQVMFRESIVHCLQREADFEILGQVSAADELVSLARQLQPTIVIIDVQMPGSPLSALRDLRRFVPQARIIFLTGSVADGLIQEHQRIGASGYLLKRYPISTLLQAIREVADGRLYFVPEVEQRLSSVRTDDLAVAETGLTRISPREMVVLRLLAEGRSVKEVACELSVSYKTVDNQTSSLMRKLDIHSRADLVRYAIREQLATV